MPENNTGQTTVVLEDQHFQIADKHGLNLSKFVRRKLEALEE